MTHDLTTHARFAVRSTGARNRLTVAERRSRFSRRARLFSLGCAAVAALAASTVARAQAAPQLPFAPGEELVYEVRSSRFGEVGNATMVVAGPETVRGREAYALRFDFRTRITFFTVEDRTRSWVDPLRMASLRYEKHERQPVSSTDEEVEIHPEERRWEAVDGSSGVSPTVSPLDELSFIYFLRTLPLVDGEFREFERHFDAERNPVVVRVVGRKVLQAPVGDFETVVVEMQVHDRGRFGGEGVMRFHLTDDERRLPIRIETSVPIAGTLVMDLVQATLGGMP